MTDDDILESVREAASDLHNAGIVDKATLREFDALCPAPLETPLMTDEAFPGGCFCGAVRYRLTSRPMFVNCCHCRDCQKQTGGAFAINAIVETDRIVLEGEAPVAVTLPAESGRPHDVYRCAKCQTALWSDYGRRRVMSFLRVATLDTPHDIQPDAHIFTRSKVPWVVLPESQPAFDIYYDMETLWPAASLERRKALLG